jgi:hypothetical protein
MYVVGIISMHLLSIVVGQGCLVSGRQQDEILDRFDAANAGLRIRVTARRVHEAYARPGAEYLVESAPPESNDFRRVMTIKADQAIPIPRRQICFVSDHVSYIFLGSYYVVTTDGGRTWSTWDSEGTLPNDEQWRRYNLSPAIKEVEIRPDGEGKMTLIPFFPQSEKGPDLYTKDFGRHWSLESKTPPK